MWFFEATLTNNLLKVKPIIGWMVLFSNDRSFEISKGCHPVQWVLTLGLPLGAYPPGRMPYDASTGYDNNWPPDLPTYVTEDRSQWTILQLEPRAAPVPVLGEWGLVIFSLLIAGGLLGNEEKKRNGNKSVKRNGQLTSRGRPAGPDRTSGVPLPFLPKRSARSAGHRPGPISEGLQRRSVQPIAPSHLFGRSRGQY